MKNLKNYIYKTYSHTFFPIFLTLFTITSIIFLVKIASLTSVIQLSFLELIELYIYNIPTILFYSLPVTIFVSLALSLSKLSSEYELIVITSFGLSPIKILKLILPTLIFSTLLTLIITLVLIPKANYLKESFVSNKEQQAQFNIKASEYGQEFGKWMIYVNEEKNGFYKDMVLYQKDLQDERFITAKRGTVENFGSFLNLNLQDGKLFDLKNNEINQVNFKKMVIHNQLRSKKDINSLNDFINYWKGDIDKLTFSILGSVFPLLSVFLILFSGYYNPRYEKNRSVVFALSATVVFIVIAHKLSKVFELQLLIYLPVIWILIGYYFYKYKIKPAY